MVDAPLDDWTVRMQKKNLKTKINSENIFLEPRIQKCQKLYGEVPEIILVISFSLNQAERKQKFITLWKNLRSTFVKHKS